MAADVLQIFLKALDAYISDNRPAALKKFIKKPECKEFIEKWKNTQSIITG